MLRRLSFVLCLSALGCSADPVSKTDTNTTTPDTDTADTTMADTTMADTDVASDTTDIVQPKTCGIGSASALAGCVETSRLTTDLAAIEGARPNGTAKNAATRDFLATRLATLGFVVERDDYGRGVNIIGTRLGKTSPEDLVVVSAHYDSIPLCPGANDNGSGVVGALEAARILAQVDHDRTLVIAFWDEEEVGLLGSYDWTDRLARKSGRVVVSVVFEMIGYRSDEDGSQTLPEGLDILFPNEVAAVHANGDRADFIALIANQSASPFVDKMHELSLGLGHLTARLIVPPTLIETSLINDLRRSDHAPFWGYDWPAISITDTGNFRNPGYHCLEVQDQLSEINFDFATRNVAIAIYAAAYALDNDAPVAVPARTPACDLVAQTGCGANKKCTIFGGGANLYQEACRNLPTESGSAGEACTRPAGIPGEDTCGAGLFCTFWGLPQTTPTSYWCRELCVADNDCPADTRCQSTVGAGPGHGVCIPSCDPFDSATCQANTHCIAEREATDRTLAFGCARLGTVQEGDACVLRSLQCEAGLMCARSSSDGTERCRKPCDASHPCETGTCVALPNPPADHPSVGTCQ